MYQNRTGHSVYKHYSGCSGYKKELIQSYSEINKIRSVNQVPKKYKNQFFKNKFEILTREGDYRLRLAKENIFIKLNRPDLNEQTDLATPLNNFV